MPSDKQVKFTFAVDAASVTAVKDAFAQITRAAKEMAAELKASGAGGMMGGSVGARPAAGAGSMQTATAAQQNKIQLNVIGPDAAKNFKDFVTAVKAGANDIKNSIGPTIALIAQLNQQVAQLKGGAGGDPLLDYSAIAARKPYRKAGGLGAAIGRVTAPGTVGGGMGSDMDIGFGGTPGGGSGGSGIWNAIASRYTGVGAGQLLGGLGAMKNNMMWRMGISPQMARAGVSVGGIYAASKILDTELSQDPYRFLDYTGQRAQATWAETSPLVRGDTRDIWATTSVLGEASKAKDYEQLGGGWQRFKHGMAGTWAGVKDFDVTQVGRAWTGEYGALEVQKQRQAMREMERGTTPFQNELWGELEQRYRGDMGMARALGVGGNNERSLFGRLQKIQAQNPNFTLAEMAQAQAQVASTGTRQAGMWMRGGVNQAEAAGIVGIGTAAGSMSRFGIGVGQDFLTTVRQMAGGGMDVSTAGMLAQFTAQQTPLIAGQTGQGMLGMLGAGAGGSTGRLIAEQNMAGVRGFQQAISGTTDPYQQARNLQIAMDIAPGAGLYAQEFLANKMNLSQLAEVASGNKAGLGGIAAGMDITPEMAQRQLKGVTRSMFDRVLGAGLTPGSRQSRTIESMMGSNLDPQAWFNKQKGQKGFNAENVVEDFAGVLLATGQADSQEAALGTARDIFHIGARPKRGRAVGDVAAGTREAEQATKEVESWGLKVKESGAILDEMTRSAKNWLFWAEKKFAMERSIGITAEERLQGEQAMEQVMRSNKGVLTHETYDAALKEIREKKATEAKEAANRGVNAGRPRR